MIGSGTINRDKARARVSRHHEKLGGGAREAPEADSGAVRSAPVRVVNAVVTCTVAFRDMTKN
jgi:hypothetical protein